MATKAAQSLDDEIERIFADAARRASERQPVYSPAPPTKNLSGDELLAELERIRAMTPPGPQSDSTEILRQLRNE